MRVVAAKASQQHQDFLKILRIRENRGKDCGVKSWRERYEQKKKKMREKRNESELKFFFLSDADR